MILANLHLKVIKKIKYLQKNLLKRLVLELKKELENIFKENNYSNFELIEGDVVKTLPIFLKKNKHVKNFFITFRLRYFSTYLFRFREIIQ